LTAIQACGPPGNRFGCLRERVGSGNVPGLQGTWNVMTFNLGTIMERLGGIETGHRAPLDWIEQWISR